MDTPRLQIGIVGCGIAGLATAIALSKAGHIIEIFERSNFSNETGAAIVIGPNGSRILAKWGLDADAAGALDFCQMRRMKADTIELDSEVSFSNIKEKYGDRWLMLHRVDLHSALKALVDALPDPTPRIHLGTAVEDIVPEKGIIHLSNGQTITKDLIVVADGSHSRLIPRVTGSESPVVRLPLSMYRFMQPFDRISNGPETAQFYKDRQPGFTTFYRAEVGKPGHILNTYPCRRGELLYCALLHPTKPNEKELEGWSTPADSEAVIRDTQGFHPAVKAICDGATDVRVYNQMYRNPISTFVKGRVVLVGDAAHLMLPTHGQGASSAIEDATALEVLLAGATTSDLASRLEAFNTLRLSRVHAVQTFSNKMMGPYDKMEQEVRKYYNGVIPPTGSKTFAPGFNDFFFKYDVRKEAEKLAKA